MTEQRDSLSFQPYGSGCCERCGQYQDELYLATLTSGEQTESMAMCGECALRLKSRVDRHNAQQTQMPVPPVPAQPRQTPPMNPQQPVHGRNTYTPYSAAQTPVVAPVRTAPAPKKTRKGIIALIAAVPLIVILLAVFVIRPIVLGNSGSSARLFSGSATLTNSQAKQALEDYYAAFAGDFETNFDASSKFDNIYYYGRYMRQYDEYDFIDQIKRNDPSEWEELTYTWDMYKDYIPESKWFEVTDVRLYSEEQVDTVYREHVQNMDIGSRFFPREELRGMAAVQVVTASGNHNTLVLSNENGKWKLILEIDYEDMPDSSY